MMEEEPVDDIKDVKGATIKRLAFRGKTLSVIFRTGDSKPLFVLRELDWKILRGKKSEHGTDSKTRLSIAHLPSSAEDNSKKRAASEQAARSSLRAVILKLKLNMQEATQHELEALRKSKVIGSRAPSCALLSWYHAKTLLRHFGKTEFVEAIDAAFRT